MPSRSYGIVLIMALLLLIVPLPASAVQGVGVDLYYLAADANGVTQVYNIDGSNVINQQSQSTENVLNFDLAYNNSLAFVTGRSLGVNGNVITTGGPLDSPALTLLDVSWSPTADRVAVVAGALDGQVDPGEGVWILNVFDNTWRLVLNSTKSDPATATIYVAVEWATSGDRLVLEANFGDGTNGTAVYNLATERNLVLNAAGTGNIQSNGYSRGNLSMDGTDIVLSDVPDSPVGNGFIVDINDYTRIIPLGDANLASRFLSHAVPIRNGTAFFIRDFGNNITTTEVWQLSNAGARVALGNLPVADLGRDVAWSADGSALVYVHEMDEASGFGTPRVAVRQPDNTMLEVELPAEVGKIRAPQWANNLTATFEQVVDLIFTEPVIEFQDDAGVRYYGVRMQWNAVSNGNGSAQIQIAPGFDGQETFDVTGNAIKFNRLACSTTFNITVTAYNADGSLGTPSEAATLSTPLCDAPLFATINDIYSGGAAAAQPVQPAESAPAEQPAAPEQPAEQPAAPEQPAEQPAEAAPPATLDLAPGSAQDGPATVTDLAAGEITQSGAFSDGRASYAIALSWSMPQEPVEFFIVATAPPFGENGSRDRFPIRVQQGQPLGANIEGLGCGTTYTIQVQSIGADGYTVLTNSQPLTVTTPPCQ